MSSDTICEKPVKVGVASNNPMKVRAVEKTFKRYCNVRGIETVSPPELPDQPHGSLEVLAGAIQRASVARKVGDFGVGIEAGPIEFYTTTGYIETQIAVILGPGERVSIGMSPSFEVPYKVLEGMLRGIELAKLVPIVRKGDLGEGVGYIGSVTNGYITRQDLTELAVVMALVQWIADFSSELQTIEEIKKSIIHRINLR